MKIAKLTESQIIGIFKQQDSGKKVSEICCEYGICKTTFQQDNKSSWNSSVLGATN